MTKINKKRPGLAHFSAMIPTHVGRHLSSHYLLRCIPSPYKDTSFKGTLSTLISRMKAFKLPTGKLRAGNKM